MLTDRRPNLHSRRESLSWRTKCSASSVRTRAVYSDAKSTFFPVFCIYVCLIVISDRSVTAKPVIGSPLKAKHIDSATMSSAVDFLTKYGYLEQTNLETGNLRTDDQLKDAIRAMQRFAGIDETGIIDSKTVKLMTRSRCGVPDLVGTSERVRRYALQGAKWNKHNLTWSIHYLSSNGLSFDELRRELTRAFKVWSEATLLTFRELHRGSEADIIISFYKGYHNDGYAFDGPGSVLAHAFFPGGGIGGDTHFDDEEEWDAGNKQDSERVSLFAVAAHEFGHSLGLSHSGDQSALMYPYYQWFGPDYALPDDDRMGIEQIYGPKVKRPWATLPGISTGPPQVPYTGVHQPTQPPRYAPTQSSGKPSTCETSYDAISVIRREVYIFKDEYFWRLNDRGLQDGYPVEISRFWYNLPPDLKRIDAIYERPRDRKIVFFIGKQYWLFNANHPESGYPQPLTRLGLPADLEKIDAAMVWGHNGKTYFFSGRQYWRFDDTESRVELDYPRSMSMWKGVPHNIDAAFQWTDGKTYFFQGPKYWKFNDQKMRVDNKDALPSAPFWMSCPDSSKHPDTVDGARELPHIGVKDSGANSVREQKSIKWAFLAVMICLYHML